MTTSSPLPRYVHLWTEEARAGQEPPDRPWMGLEQAVGIYRTLGAKSASKINLFLAKEGEG